MSVVGKPKQAAPVANHPESPPAQGEHQAKGAIDYSALRKEVTSRFPKTKAYLAK